MDTIDISGIPKEALLAALYNNSKPIGMGFFDPHSSRNLSEEEAKQIINNTKNASLITCMEG